MLIGLVGKPNIGKSTFFKALTLMNVLIENYPFATITPNRGAGHVRVKCVEDEFNIKCTPARGFCIDGNRFIPVGLLDVAGLVPGAHSGKGMGNQFLDDLRQADPTSPSNTLSPDDYYTNYINQDAISNDNQQYVTGFSHIMYYTRAEKSTDTFTPATSHEVSATADIKFHSVDNGDSLLYKFYYKDNSTDRYLYFDTVLTFEAGDTITTPDAGVTLVIDNDTLPSTYDHYKGKHLQYNGETRTILELDDFNKSFVLDSAFSSTPVTGDGVEIVCEQPATLVTSWTGDNEFMLDDETGIITPSAAGVSHKVVFTYIAIFRTW